VSNENFRRELGHVFDDMTGSPSGALSDRVRSSLAEAPEQRGPFWIAGVAAAVIAAVLIAVLFVGNPLNRPGNTIGPGAGASPTPSATVAPTPDSNLPAFVCGTSTSLVPKTASTPPPLAYVSAVRTGTHPGYDRLTIEFVGGQWSSIDVSPQSGTTFTNSPMGDQVTLSGKNGILVIIHGADMHTSYAGPGDVKTGYATLVEVRGLEDFEGVVQLGMGVSGGACYRAFILTDPARLVIDVQAG